MKCPNCRKKIPNSAKYCKYCACPVSGSQVKRKSKGNKLRIVMISVSCCLIVAVGVTGYIFYQWYNSPSQEILRELKSEDYKDAVRIFNRNYDEDDDIPEDIVTKVTSILESEYTAFQNEEKSYSTVTNNIDTLSEMNIEELEDEIEEVQDSIDSLNASRTAFDTAESYMEDGNYEDAIAQYKLVIQDDSNYDTAQTRMEEAVTSYRTEVLEDAAEKASSGNVSGAITILKSGLNVLENDSEFTQQLTVYQNQLEDDAIADALEEAEIYAESKNYESAIAVLEKALNSYSSDASLQAAYDTYTDEFVNYVIAEANSLINENDYSSAITKLEAAVKVVDSDTLTDMLAQTKENQPVNLTELKSQNADDFWIESSAVEDVFGNIYSGKNVWEIGGRVPNSCEFYTGENYTTLTGTIIPKTDFGSAVAVNFEIYVDGELKYSQKVTQKMEPTSFEVDVTGGKWVKIKVSEIEGSNSGSYSYNTIILYNPVLTK